MAEDLHVDVYDVEGTLLAEVALPLRLTVHALKSQLAERIHVPPLCQHLTSKDVVLQDHEGMEVLYFGGRNTGMMMDVTMVKNFDTLTDNLGHDLGIIREATLTMLGGLPHEDYQFVLDNAVCKLDDMDPEVRRAAVYTLWSQASQFQRNQQLDELKEHNNMCTKLLAKRIADNSALVRQAASEALLFTCARGEKSAITALKKHFKHWNKGVRVMACRTIAAIASKGDNEVTQALCEAFSDPDSEVRQEAAKALSKVGDRLVVSKVGKMCADQTIDTRRQAINSLPAVLAEENNAGEDLAQSSLDAIIALMTCLRDPAPEIRVAAVECMARCAPENSDEAIIALCGQLGMYRAPRPPPPKPKKNESDSEEEDEDDFYSETDSDGGRRKVKKEPPPPPTIVVPPMDLDPLVRKAAIEGLMQVAPSNDLMAFRIMVDRFLDESFDVRRAAETALLEKFANKDDARIIPAFVKLTTHKNADIRCRAVKVLQTLVTEGEPEPMFEEVPEPDPDEAFEALELMIESHEDRMDAVREKIEECRAKPKTGKTTKMKRMFKATLLRLETDPKYVNAKLEVDSGNLQDYMDFIEEHRAKIQDMKDTIKKTKKTKDKAPLKEYLKELEEQEDYLAAVRKVEGPSKAELELEAFKAEMAKQAHQAAVANGTAAAAAPAAAAPAAGDDDDEAEAEESDCEGLEQEEVFEHFLHDTDEEEEAARQAAPPPSPRPKGPLTAIVRMLRKEGSWEVLQTALEAISILAPADPQGVFQAVRPLVSHQMAEIRLLAIAILGEKQSRLSQEDKKLLSLRFQDRNILVRAAAIKAHG